MYTICQVMQIAFPSFFHYMSFQKTALVVMEFALRTQVIYFAKGSIKRRLLRRQTKNKEIFVISRKITSTVRSV